MDNILSWLGVVWGAVYYLAACVMLTRAYFIHTEHNDPSGSIINFFGAAGMLGFGSILYSAMNGGAVLDKILI